MPKLLMSIVFLAAAVAVCLYLNDGPHPCTINAPMEQSQCRIVGKPLVAKKVFYGKNY